MIEANERFENSSRGSWDSKRSKYRYSPTVSDAEDKDNDPKYKKGKSYKKNRPDGYSSDGGEYRDSNYRENVIAVEEVREHSNNHSSQYSDGDEVEFRGTSRPKRSKKKRRRRSRSTSRRRRSNSTTSSSSQSSSRSSSSSRQNSDDKGYHLRRHESKTRSRSREYRSASRARKQDSSPYTATEGQQQSGWYPPQRNFVANDQQNMSSYQAQHISASYPEGTYPANYQNQNFGSNYHQYPGYEQSSYYQNPNFQHQPQPQTHDYTMGGPAIQGANWDNNVVYPDISQPPPVLASTSSAPPGELLPSAHGDKKTEEAKKEAVEQELIQQKRTLAKQREEYIRRKISLSRELSRLKDQKRDLLKENSKDNERILRENAKLQGEIQAKLKSIDNVIEMLTNIIGDKERLPEVIKDISKKEVSKKPDKRKRSESPPPVPKKSDWYKDSEQARSSSPDVGEKAGKFESQAAVLPPTKSHLNLVHYDPELHWCSDCNVFPRTVIDYLNHLHSEEHKMARSKVKLEEMPWHLSHTREQTPPFVKDAPCKRIPIRGVQFLVPSTAWYCSLCSEWLGDLLCTSKHLKSNLHAKNYSDFIVQNPHWEVDWLTERTRSYERNSEAKTRMREFSEVGKGEPCASSSSVQQQQSFTIASLSDQLLAMLAQNSKLVSGGGNLSASATNLDKKSVDSSAESTAESQEDKSPTKERKKKKKSKKKKRGGGDRSPKSKKSSSPGKFGETSKNKDIDLYEDMENDLVDSNLKSRKGEKSNKPNSSLEYLYNNDFQVPDDKKDYHLFKSKNESVLPKEAALLYNTRRNYIKGRAYEEEEDNGEYKYCDSDSENARNQKFGRAESQMQRHFQETKIVLNAGDIEYKSLKRDGRDFNNESEKPLSSKYKVPDDDDEAHEKAYEKYGRSPDGKYHRKSDKKRDYSGKDLKRDRYESSKSYKSHDYSQRDFKRDKDGSQRDRSNKDSRDGKSKDKQKNRDKEDKNKFSSRKSPDRERKSKKFFIPGKDMDDDNSETIFEKRTSESAAKKKDVKKTSFNLPKAKLPFIGRMPILKKKTEQKSEDSINEDKREAFDTEMKVEETVAPVFVPQMLPEPEFREEYQVVQEGEFVDQTESAVPLPKSTLIISKRPRLSEPEIVKKEILFKQKSGDDNLLEQDMDIDDDHPKDELHKDFKDALDLLFPENKDKDGEDDSKGKTEVKDAEVQQGPVPYDVAMMAQNLGYDMSMYHTDQSGYSMAYYDQAAYMQHQAAYMSSMGYDPNQALPQGYVMDPSAYMQSTGVEAQVATATSTDVPPLPPGLDPNLADDSQNQPLDIKKKNPLSQRMRRHLKKKAMESEKSKSSDVAEVDEEDEDQEKTEETVKKPFIPQEMSDLALLGIEEGDITAQSFF